MNLKKHNLALGLLLGVLSCGAIALESDRQQPLKIVADSAELNDKDGTATYTGNVILTQGSLKIQADYLLIKTADNKVTFVSARGNPARFSQQPAEDQLPVKASGLGADYDVKAQTLTLRRKASVVQNDNTFKGEEIVYELQNQRLKAVGQTKDTPKGEGSGRVEMILPSASVAPETSAKPAEPAKPEKAAP